MKKSHRPESADYLHIYTRAVLYQSPVAPGA